ncbi:MAG: hybrid sensor histidine kinase/response regulator, partial [Symploca sp. SIO2D2]|nr:hybrid sensor histidine kinase/response regulator [Symploca sp. SIO2D2]
MTTIREQGYRYFLQEAPELLQALEQDLLTLREDCSINKVHNLMRTTHTLKGAAASVGLETIKTVAHYLEDIFKALCKPDISIEPEVEALLFEGYECLRLPLTAELTGGQVDEAGVKSRTAAVFAQLEEKLGDCFAEEAHLPSSVELGFDVTQSIFEVGVTQRLEELAAVLESGQLIEVATSLRTQAEVFLGLAESLVLPGFGDIARSAIAALDAHPEQAQTIAEISLADFREGQEAVLNGDRNLGGSPSVALRELTGISGKAEGSSAKPLPQAGQKAEGKEDKEDEVQFTLVERLPNQESVTQLEVEEVTDAVELGKEAGADSLLEVIWGGTEELEENVAVTDDSIFISLDDELEENTAIADDSAFISVDDELEEELAVVYDSALVSWEEESGEDARVSNDFVSLSLGEEDGRGKKEEKEKSSPQSPTIPTLTELPSTVRVKVQHLEHLNYSVGELLTNHNRQLLQNEQLQTAVRTLVSRFQQHRQLLEQLRDGEINSKFKIQNSKLPLRSIVSKARHNNQQPTTNNNKQNLFDSLELDEYSETQLLIQSVLEDAVQLAEANDAIELFARQSYQTLETQRRLLTSTRDVLMEVRMVPLGEIFAPLPRVIRQLEVRHHKPVTLEIRGTEVMVDKVVAQKLYDPLLHLVRNAFDHGVESPEIRREQGKEEKGQIRVCAYYRGRYLVIEVGDDG